MFRRKTYPTWVYHRHDLVAGAFLTERQMKKLGKEGFNIMAVQYDGLGASTWTYISTFRCSSTSGITPPPGERFTPCPWNDLDICGVCRRDS